MELITECCNRPISHDERFCSCCGWEAGVTAYVRKQEEMQPHQQRVVTERDELAEKLSKLNSFIGGDIFHSLSAEERIRLAKQAGVMKDYLDILNERISVFSE